MTVGAAAWHQRRSSQSPRRKYAKIQNGPHFSLAGPISKTLFDQCATSSRCAKPEERQIDRRIKTSAASNRRTLDALQPIRAADNDEDEDDRDREHRNSAHKFMPIPPNCTKGADSAV
jgi:hypothetical protein